MDFTELRAKAFATRCHAEQRYGDQPYLVHLTAVRQVLRDFHVTARDLCHAAWLHDVVEDTPTTIDEIRSEFGADVAELVWAVTGVGANRRERNAAMYTKCRTHPRAVHLKLADRIANVEASSSHPEKLAMYQREMGTFRRELGDWGTPAMWARLDRALRAA